MASLRYTVRLRRRIELRIKVSLRYKVRLNNIGGLRSKFRLRTRTRVMRIDTGGMREPDGPGRTFCDRKIT